MRILVVEDHTPLCRLIVQGLVEKGYAADSSPDGEEGLWYARNHAYDALILDIMLPKIDGLTVLKTIREERNPVPVLILTAKGEVKDRVTGLNMGADDYLVKPFAFAELLARLRALIRRSHQEACNDIEIADLKINIHSRSVTRNGQSIRLSKREFDLLEFLALRKDQTVSRAEILDGLYDFQDDASANLVDVYISYLRKKIDAPFEKKLIHTKWGQGFVIGENIE